MQDVIVRLRGSALENESADRKQGFEEGTAWAMHSAEARELENLERFRANLRDTDWEHYFTTNETNAYSSAELFYSAIDPDGDIRLGAKDFWESALDDIEMDSLSDSRIVGFAEGALNIWAGVKSKL